MRVRATGSGKHLREGMEPFVEGDRRRIVRCRRTPKGYLVDLEGVHSRSEAGALRGAELVLDRGELDDPEEGEFYVADLIGLSAVNEAGEDVGIVAETFATPAHEVLVVRGSGAESLIPFTHEHVPRVSLEEARIVVRIPEG